MKHHLSSSHIKFSEKSMLYTLISQNIWVFASGQGRSSVDGNTIENCRIS